MRRRALSRCPEDEFFFKTLDFILILWYIFQQNEVFLKASPAKRPQGGQPGKQIPVTGEGAEGT
jgi:hypothetical protein